MLMSKEERTVKLFDKEVMLSGFYPKEGETIFVTIDTEKVDYINASEWCKYLHEIFPNNSIMIKPDGMTIESMMEDDLK